MYIMRLHNDTHTTPICTNNNAPATTDSKQNMKSLAKSYTDFMKRKLIRKHGIPL